MEQMPDDQTVHDLGLWDLLLAATWKGLKPERICLIGIQPESLEMGLEMTPLIRDRMEELLKRVVAKLREWDVYGQAIPRRETICRGTHLSAEET